MQLEFWQYLIILIVKYIVRQTGICVKALGTLAYIILPSCQLSVYCSKFNTVWGHIFVWNHSTSFVIFPVQTYLAHPLLSLHIKFHFVFSFNFSVFHQPDFLWQWITLFTNLLPIWFTYQTTRQKLYFHFKRFKTKTNLFRLLYVIPVCPIYSSWIFLTLWVEWDRIEWIKAKRCWIFLA